MAKDWAYAKAVSWIAEHGGPQKALDIVKDYYTQKGFESGVASQKPIIAVVGGLCLATGVIGKTIYDRAIQKNTVTIEAKNSKQKKVEEAEEELIKAIRVNKEADETNEQFKQEAHAE